MDQVPGELSSRELEILQRVASGVTNQQVAVDLGISINTVKAHLRNIYAKLNVESRTEATLYAIQQGLITLEGVPAAGDGDVEPEAASAAPTLPTHRLEWTVGWLQWGVGLATLVVAVALALWPTIAAPASGTASRFTDAPAAAGPAPLGEEASRWSARTPMPMPRGRFALAQVDEAIYLIGGLTDQGWTSRVEAYHPADDSWLRASDKPTSVANMGAAVIGGLIYVPGGMDAANRVQSAMEVYDPAQDRWTDGVAAPAPLCAYALAVYDRGFYVIGGWDGKRYVDSVYHYAVDAQAWTLAGRLPQARGFGAAQRIGDRIYVTGGYDGESEYATCASFAVGEANAVVDWVVHAPMQEVRAGHSMVLLDGSLYVVGGGWERPFRFNERYDAANNAWSTFDSPIVGEWRNLGMAPITTQRGLVLIAFGGWNGSYLSVVEAYQAVFRVFLPS